MLQTYFRVALSIALVSSLLDPAGVSAQQAKFDEKAVGDFYRGKTIRIIIGSGAGGTGAEGGPWLVPADVPPSFAPHSPQNFCPPGTTCPHDGQSEGGACERRPRLSSSV
mgnify:CR=1 FL=1